MVHTAEQKEELPLIIDLLVLVDVKCNH